MSGYRETSLKDSRSKVSAPAGLLRQIKYPRHSRWGVCRVNSRLADPNVFSRAAVVGFPVASVDSRLFRKLARKTALS